MILCLLSYCSYKYKMLYFRLMDVGPLGELCSQNKIKYCAFFTLKFLTHLFFILLVQDRVVVKCIKFYTTLSSN